MEQRGDRSNHTPQPSSRNCPPQVNYSHHPVAPATIPISSSANPYSSYLLAVEQAQHVNLTVGGLNAQSPGCARNVRPVPVSLWVVSSRLPRVMFAVVSHRRTPNVRNDTLPILYSTASLAQTALWLCQFPARRHIATWCLRQILSKHRKVSILAAQSFLER